MKNNQTENNPKISGFVGFLPKPLRLENKPELSVFPFNVLIGRYTIRDGKQILGSALYEPDLSSLKMDESRNLILVYKNRYDSRYKLKIFLDKSLKIRICEKYRENELIATANGILDWEKTDESWKKFFMQVALIGLDNGETCRFDVSDENELSN